MLIQRKPLKEEPETALSNILTIVRLPDTIKLFTPSRDVPSDEAKAFIPLWSFRRVDANKFLSFQSPPQTVLDNLAFQEANTYAWRELEKVEGILVTSLVSELIKKAMRVKCHEKGLLYCEESRLRYFPKDLVAGNWLNYLKADGSKGRLLAVGERTLWRTTGSQKYQYYLAPDFTVHQYLFDPFTVLVHLRIRFTTEHGKPLIKRNALTRRKHLCHDWWNDDWINRLLAVCRFLGDGEHITIGDSDEQIAISSHLKTFSSPVGIDEQYVDQATISREEFVGDEAGEDTDEEVEQS
jgi:hypothetical protein